MHTHTHTHTQHTHTYKRTSIVHVHQGRRHTLTLARRFLETPRYYNVLLDQVGSIPKRLACPSISHPAAELHLPVLDWAPRCIVPVSTCQIIPRSAHFWPRCIVGVSQALQLIHAHVHMCTCTCDCAIAHTLTHTHTRTRHPRTLYFPARNRLPTHAVAYPSGCSGMARFRSGASRCCRR